MGAGAAASRGCGASFGPGPINRLVSWTLYRTEKGKPFRSSCKVAMLPDGPINLAATLPKGTLETGYPSTEIRMSPIWILPLSEAGLLGLMDTTCGGSSANDTPEFSRWFSSNARWKNTAITGRYT